MEPNLAAGASTADPHRTAISVPEQMKPLPVEQSIFYRQLGGDFQERRIPRKL
jgi:hypothetical protein